MVQRQLNAELYLDTAASLKKVSEFTKSLKSLENLQIMKGVQDDLKTSLDHAQGINKALNGLNIGVDARAFRDLENKVKGLQEKLQHVKIPELIPPKANDNVKKFGQGLTNMFLRSVDAFEDALKIALIGGGSNALIGQAQGLVGSIPGANRVQSLLGGLLSSANPFNLAGVQGLQQQFAIGAQDQQSDIQTISLLQQKFKSSYEEAQDFLDGFESSMARIASALPGSTDAYVRIAKTVQDDIFGLVQNSAGEIDQMGRDRLQEILVGTRETPGLAAGFGALEGSTGQGAIALSRLLQGASTRSIQQLMFGEQNVSLLSEIDNALKKRGKDTLQAVSLQDRVDVLFEALNVALSPEAMRRMSATGSSAIEGFRTSVSSITNGFLSIKRPLEVFGDAVRNSRNPFEAFDKIVIDIFDGERGLLAGPLQMLEELKNTRFDPMVAVTTLLDEFRNEYLIGVIHQIDHLFQNATTISARGDVNFDFGMIFSGLFNIINRVIDDLPKLYDRILRASDALNQVLAQVDFKDIGQTVGRAAAEFVGFLADIISNSEIWSGIGEAFEGFFEGFAMSGGLQDLAQIWLETKKIEMKMKGGPIGITLDVTSRISQAIAAALPVMLAPLISGFVKSTVTTIFAALGIGKFLAWLGTAFTAGWALVKAGAIATITSSAAGLVASIAAVGSIFSIFGNMFDRIKDDMNDLVFVSLMPIFTVLKVIGSPFFALFEALKEFASSMLRGEGFKQAWQNASEAFMFAMADVASSIAEDFRRMGEIFVNALQFGLSLITDTVGVAAGWFQNQLVSDSAIGSNASTLGSSMNDAFASFGNVANRASGTPMPDLLAAAAREKARAPSGSDLVMANSSEMIIPPSMLSQLSNTLSGGRSVQINAPISIQSSIGQDEEVIADMVVRKLNEWVGQEMMGILN